MYFIGVVVLVFYVGSSCTCISQFDAVLSNSNTVDTHTYTDVSVFQQQFTIFTLKENIVCNIVLKSKI